MDLRNRWLIKYLKCAEKNDFKVQKSKNIKSFNKKDANLLLKLIKLKTKMKDGTKCLHGKTVSWLIAF